MDLPKIYEFAGGAQAFRALAGAHHRRCLQDPLFRELLRQYLEWAVLEVDSYSPEGSEVPSGLPFPQWGWGGREEPPSPGPAG